MIESQRELDIDELAVQASTALPLPAATSNSVVKESSLNLPKIVPFEMLCKCGDEVWIENEGTIYRLRKTKQGKLILTK